MHIHKYSQLHFFILYQYVTEHGDKMCFFGTLQKYER
jgi:hypothetical protein